MLSVEWHCGYVLKMSSVRDVYWNTYEGNGMISVVPLKIVLKKKFWGGGRAGDRWHRNGKTLIIVEVSDGTWGLIISSSLILWIFGNLPLWKF